MLETSCSVDAKDCRSRKRDSRKRLTYTQGMDGDGAHIRLKLDTEEPMALTDFVGSFTGLGNQFDRFIASEHPGTKMLSEFFVKEVRVGCIEADLLAMVMPIAAAGAIPGVIDTIDKAQVLAQFVNDIRDRISPYFTPGGRAPKATKSDLNDFLKALGGVARDPRASGRLEAAVFEDGKRQVRAAFRFTSAEARTAEQEIEEHRAELTAKTESDYQRVLLRFVRPSVEAGKPGKKGGERGVIEKIHRLAHPILYASDLAEQRVRAEFLATDGNVFRRLFDVDVNVELGSSGRPLAYRIVALHEVIDIEDDEESDMFTP